MSACHTGATHGRRAFPPLGSQRARMMSLRSVRNTGPDPDGPPPEAIGRPDAVVVDQSPESGAVVPPGTSVTLWVERGGGSGVREPRQPKPEPRLGRVMQDEPTSAWG